MNHDVLADAEAALTLAPARHGGEIKLYPPSAFEGMRRAGRLGAETLDHVAPFVRPGVTTSRLDEICHEFVLDHGAVPAPLYYRGFPRSVCISINHVVCHGIPGERVLEEGDILNIDVTVMLDGWHGDTSRMYYAGKVARKAERLCEVTYQAMMRGIEVVKPGATTGDIGHAIQSFAHANRYSVVRDFCGHGIGRAFHDAPNILHYGEPDAGVRLREGMLFTVEPMINQGKWHTRMLDDGWTAVTRDRSLSAQFEHCVGITADGAEVFTTSPAGLHFPPYGG
jgi:methionyl aminopeptidase